MRSDKISIDGIPTLVFGEKSDKVYLYVHGKCGCKENASAFAEIAAERGYQTVSFDLPEHGDRKNESARCDVFDGVESLKKVGEYVFGNWQQVSLFACSIGAFFSLCAYKDRRFESCLFQSPIVDMKQLIKRMMLWFNISEKELEEKVEIRTPVDLMTWRYFCYVHENPVECWKSPTSILYASEDNLQSIDDIERFAKYFCCQLKVSQGSEHPFMNEHDLPIVESWLKENI